MWTFLVGFHADLYVSLLLSLPLLLWFALVPNRSFGRRWHRGMVTGCLFCFWLVEFFLVFTEFYFFEEFKSRFNTVAVDYLLYPHEVFINIWDAYPVATVLIICAMLSAAWNLGARKLFAGMWQQSCSPGSRWLHVAGVAALSALLTPTIHLKGPRFSQQRLINELANNGALSFVSAFWTHHLDYAAFYRTMPRDEAYLRVRRLLAGPGKEFTGPPDSIRRRVAGDSNRPRLNVVIILEESLGSEFFGLADRKGATLMPEMERLASEQGLFFTNVYASGNRTVRGFEGVLSSFPPLPGEAIVKRDLSQNVETIARILKRDGYATLFLYGGRGIFDSMRVFALDNGYDRFIEQKHFTDPTFSTIWGVCDEDLFARAIMEFRELAKSDRPFLGTILTVSNHKPFTYPKGRIRENPDLRRREHAVKYADYALGRFFDAARKESFWTNTVFALVADHGARVYGSQSIPIRSYEIPFLIVGPAVVKKAACLPHLGSALDVAPTILGLIGRPYDTMFFGRDLLKQAPGEGRVWLNHNRDIGMLAHRRLVVLGLRHSIEFYQGDPKAEEMTPLSNPTLSDEELLKDTMAVFQVADDLYIHQRYRIDD
jgi:phosphoglycerol transferase MdoB-like AlkP superfamily enzyme